MFASGPMEVDIPLQGQVIDADTKKPIAGVAIRLDRTAQCPRFFHGSDSHQFPPLAGKTDLNGSFTVSGDGATVSCAFRQWTLYFRVIAPGYLSYSRDISNLYVSGQGAIGTIELYPIRYLLELDDYHWLAENTRMLSEARKARAPVWDETLATARSRPFRTVGRTGVFASRPDAVFIVERGCAKSTRLTITTF